MGAIPARPDHLRQLPGPDPPVGPGEDRTADKEHQEHGQETGRPIHSTISLHDPGKERIEARRMSS